MSQPSAWSPEIEQDLHGLLTNMLDQQLTDGEQRRLGKILLSHVEAQRWYLRYCELHNELWWLDVDSLPSPLVDIANELPAELRWLHGNAELAPESGRTDHPVVADALERLNAESPTSLLASPSGLNGRFVNGRRRIARASRFVGLAASILLIGYFMTVVGLLVWDRIHRTDDYRHIVTQPIDEPAALLARADDCSWSQGSAAAAGDKANNRTLRIHTGLAELEFTDGAKVIVEGPAEFQVRSSNRGYLRRGKLMATVPPQAAGFTIETPTAEVVDLGTEFGVEVDVTGETAVQVLQGKVDVEPRDSTFIAIGQHQAEGRQRLVAGQSSVIAFTQAATRSAPSAAFNDFLRRVRGDRSPATDDKALVIASDVESGARGYRSDWSGTFGMDFDVLAPIEIQRLGVFDSGSDGIDPSSRLTVEIWSRNMSGTPTDQSDDRPGKRLARQEFSAESPGQLIGGNRFKPLALPLRLEQGTYTLIAWGFNRANSSARLIAHGADEMFRTSPGINPTEPASLQQTLVGVAGPLPVFSATDSSHYWNRTATQLINGITAGNDMTGHQLEVAGVDCNRMWLTDGKSSAKDEYVIFDLTGQHGATQHVATAKVWNYHELIIGKWNTHNRGVKEITIQCSLDGNNWLDLINPMTNTRIFTLTKGPDKENYDGDLANVLSLGIGGIDTRYVRFRMQSKYDTENLYLGLSEVRFFEDTPVTKRWVLNDCEGQLLFLPWCA